MKRFYFILTAFAMVLFSSCTRNTDYKSMEKTFESLSEPDAMAYYHNIILDRFLSDPATKSSDILSDGYVRKLYEIVKLEINSAGFSDSLSEEDIEKIESITTDFRCRLNESVTKTIAHYGNLLPFDYTVKQEIIRLSQNDVLNGTYETIKYVDELLYNSNNPYDSYKLKCFSSIGRASMDFWEQYATKSKVDARGWIATFADAAAGVIIAGLPGVVLSAALSLTAGYGEPNYEDSLDTNCD